MVGVLDVYATQLSNVDPLRQRPCNPTNPAAAVTPGTRGKQDGAPCVATEAPHRFTIEAAKDGDSAAARTAGAEACGEAFAGTAAAYGARTWPIVLHS